MKLKQPLSMQRLSPRSGENCAKNVACATTGLFSSLPIMNLITKALLYVCASKEKKSGVHGERTKYTNV
jgi:hypothetical protein